MAAAVSRRSPFQEVCPGLQRFFSIHISLHLRSHISRQVQSLRRTEPARLYPQRAPDSKRLTQTKHERNQPALPMRLGVDSKKSGRSRTKSLARHIFVTSCAEDEFLTGILSDWEGRQRWFFADGWRPNSGLETSILSGRFFLAGDLQDSKSM